MRSKVTQSVIGNDVSNLKQKRKWSTARQDITCKAFSIYINCQFCVCKLNVSSRKTRQKFDKINDEMLMMQQHIADVTRKLDNTIILTLSHI